MAELTHADESGGAKMVDVGQKRATRRRALARGRINLKPATIRRIRQNQIRKGGVVETAKVAGIMAAKRTSELIPLCHAVALDSVEVRISLDDTGAEIEAAASAMERTGVEMEAFVAVSVAALTVYDMVKAIDRSAVITDIRLIGKSGGKSDFARKK